MTPKIFKVSIHTYIAVAAMDEAEAKQAAKRHCFVDGATQKIDKPVLVTDLTQLPYGWNGGELTFTNYPDCREPWGQQSIKYWLNKQKETV